MDSFTVNEGVNANAFSLSACRDESDKVRLKKSFSYSSTEVFCSHLI